MIDLEAGRQLLDFGARIGGGPRAEEQLRGAVAIHNLLASQGVAYLADEVGMGKTYVALGAVALFRHFQPDFRVLVIAPKQNIQEKWQKEWSQLVSHNVRFDDLRVRAPGGRPARAMVHCENLIDLLHTTSLDPDRDFFVRMTSFSLGIRDTSEAKAELRDELLRQLPWLPPDAFRGPKKEFKERVAQAICCGLPLFDLVIVDEAHNLKHGFGGAVSARNSVLGTAFGRAEGVDRSFKGYGPRARRVLFLSATPLEESYHHVWNQLDLFGRGGAFDELRRPDVTDEAKQKVAQRFLIRRVTSIRTGGEELTKNQYRREWRAGGVAQHDDPIETTDPKQRLIVALIQKKVSELLGSSKFNNSFQVGMLASFESFMATSVGKLAETDGVFDDTSQTDDDLERLGMDVHEVNRIGRRYRERFGREMPHPKMDALVDSLADSWESGRKALIFVRRVASVKELKRKLDERYDAWLLRQLRARMPAVLLPELEKQIERYQAQRVLELEVRERRAEQRPVVDSDEPAPGEDESGGSAGGHDHGGVDTFFAWFFRGEGPAGVVSGANIQQRFVKRSGAYGTFFDDNHVMALLGAEPGSVLEALGAAIGTAPEETRGLVRRGAAKYLSQKAKDVTRGKRLEAAQSAALELLAERASGTLQTRAKVVSQLLSNGAQAIRSVRDAPPEIADALELSTFFTELRAPRWRELRQRIWPEVIEGSGGYALAFREQLLRQDLLAAAARLGHAFVDLYLTEVEGRSTLQLARRRDATVETGVGQGPHEGDRRAGSLVARYLDLLDGQRQRADRPWAAFDELASIADNLHVILDANVRDAWKDSVGALSKRIATLMGAQQPVSGMARQVNKSLIRQFRMPGYPLVLISTDLLQEGEDLHTFCSTVIHYGISWTPSAMEQRVGRVDRVRSATDRRLTGREAPPAGHDLLQVHFPFLRDTVEVLQVERVLERMNTFLRLMHAGLAPPSVEEKRIDVGRALAGARPRVEPIKERLVTAFPIPDGATKGPRTSLAADPSVVEGLRSRLAVLQKSDLGLGVQWTADPVAEALLGELTLDTGRVQPFRLVLRCEKGLPVGRCISPVGRTEPRRDASAARLVEMTRKIKGARVCAVAAEDAGTYDLTVEDDVLLVAQEYDAARVGLLIRRVAEAADAIEQGFYDDERDLRLDEFQPFIGNDGFDV